MDTADTVAAAMTEHAGALPGAQLVTPALARNYIFAGNATFTVVSKRTGQRKTFKLQRAKVDPNHPARKPGWFAKLLTGPDNTSNYRYLGFIYQPFGGDQRASSTTRQRHTVEFALKLNRQGWAKDALAVLDWLFNYALESDFEFAKCELWHTGHCGKCGRELTVPESVASGIGPVCDGKATKGEQ